MSSLADFALSRPWTLLAAAIGVGAVAIAAAAGAPGHLGAASSAASAGERELIVVLEATDEAGAGALSVARDAVTVQIDSDPGASDLRVLEPASGGREAVLVAELDGERAEREATVERLARDLDPGLLDLALGGATAARVEARDRVVDELGSLLLPAAVPVLLLAVLAVGARMVLAAVLSVAVAVAGAVCSLRLATVAGADPSLLGTAPALPVGVVLGIELPALIVRIHREEAAISPHRDAVHRATQVAAPTLAAAAVLAVLPAVALLVTPLGEAASLALGCAAAAVLAAVAALVVTPPTLVLFGAPGSPSGDREGRGVAYLRAVGGRLPGALAATPLRSWVAAVLALGAGCVLAYPVLDGVSRPFAAIDLPPGSPALAASMLVDAGSPAPGSLFGDLPAAAAVAAGLVGLAVVTATWSPAGLLAAPFALLPAAAGLGVCVQLIQQGEIVGAAQRGVLDAAAVAAAAASLAAIGAARAAIVLDLARAQRRLGIDGAGAAELAGARSLPGAFAAGLAGACVGAALLGSDLDAPRELGVALAAGLVADLVLVRVPLLAVLARAGRRRRQAAAG